MIWLRLPDSWPPPAAAAVTLLLLTALDVTGTIAAKEAVERRSAEALWFAAAGAAVFVLMFWVFASSLRLTGLVVVTVGWCVLVQVAVLFLDRLHYGEPLPPGKILAVVLAVAAQVYLVAGPSPAAAAQAEALDPAAPAVRLSELLEQTVPGSGPDGGQRPATGRHAASTADPGPRRGRHVAPDGRPAHARRRGPDRAFTAASALPQAGLRSEGALR